MIAEYQNGAAPAAPTREYIYSGGARRGGPAKIESGAVQYYHQDHLSVRTMTDSSGNVIGQQGHYPFGESWYETGTTTKWMFTTYERDSESGNAPFASRTGLRDDYAMARYNVNRLGRFASPDLLAGSRSDPQSLNRYAYALNDAVNLVDPLGLDPEWGCFEGSANWPSCQFSSGGEGEGGAGADIAVVPAPLSGPGCTWDTITLTIHCPDPDPVAEGDPYFYYCAAYGWCGPPADPGAHDLAGQGGGGGGAQGPGQPQKPSRAVCAANLADKYSIAGAVGTIGKQGFFANVFNGVAGNTISGLTLAFSGGGNKYRLATSINNATFQGSASAINAITTPAPVTQLGLTSTVGGELAGEGLGGILSGIKLGYDAVSFGVAYFSSTCRSGGG